MKSWKSTRTEFLNKTGSDKNIKCYCETEKDNDRRTPTGFSNRKQLSDPSDCSTAETETEDRVKKLKSKWDGMEAE